MSKQLIVDGVDMLDPRAIGLKYWFKQYFYSDEVANILFRVDVAQELQFVTPPDVTSYKYCRIAQGDKTAYDGKGQPVPDGVIVRVWFDDNKEWSTEGLVENYSWHNQLKHHTITHYEVQEMPVEQEIVSKNNLIITSKQAVAIMEAGGYTIQDTLPEFKVITTKLQSEIVGCLGLYKNLLRMVDIEDDPNIDRILKELSL